MDHSLDNGVDIAIIYELFGDLWLSGLNVS